MNEVDLHLHTTASDGLLSPAALVALAAERGLRYIAITDHDSTEAVDPALEATRSYPGLTTFPGIEMSTDIPGAEVHVLGYLLDYRNAAFQTTLRTLRGAREERARMIIARLADLGVKISWERVKELAGSGAVGRLHIAHAMMEQGYVPSLQEAFLTYIGRRGPAYAERYKLTPAESIQLLLGVGGLPVLAHPGDLENLGALLPELVEAGLVGLEAHYYGYAPELVGRLLDLARRYRLLATGGTDYHGREPGAPPGSVYVPLSAAEELLALKARRIASSP